MLQASKDTTLLLVTPANRSRLITRPRSNPSRLDLVASYIWQTVRQKPRAKFFTGTGKIRMSAVAELSGLDEGSLSRILSGKQTPDTVRVTEGLMRMRDLEDRAEFEDVLLRRYQPVPVGVFRNYPVSKAKKKS